MEARVCKKCGETKPLSAFSLRSDGKPNLRCRACINAHYRAYRAARSDVYRERAHIRYLTNEKRREQLKEWARNPKSIAAKKRYRLRNMVKIRAHGSVRKALKSGRLVRQPCEICGKVAQAHHDDYTKRLDVRWLCPEHHAEWHRHNKPICPDQSEVA